MANPYKLTRSALLSWLPNLFDRLDGNEVVPIDPTVQDARALVIAGVLSNLQLSVTDLATAEAVYHAAVSAAEVDQLAALDAVQSVKYLMKSDGCDGSVFALCGFDPPVLDPMTYVPVAPADLSAFGYSNGVNRLRFTGNNLSGAVNYMIEALVGDAVAFEVVGSTTRQRFDHLGVVPGVRYEYRVFARAASSDSEPSGSAVVY